MGHRHVQDPAADLADPGLVALGFADRRVPGVLEFFQASEPAVTPGGEQLAQDIGQRPRSAAFRARHAERPAPEGRALRSAAPTGMNAFPL